MGIVITAGINCKIPLVTEFPVMMHGIAEDIDDKEEIYYEKVKRSHLKNT